MVVATVALAVDRVFHLRATAKCTAVEAACQIAQVATGGMIRCKVASAILRTLEVTVAADRQTVSLDIKAEVQNNLDSRRLGSSILPL